MTRVVRSIAALPYTRRPRDDQRLPAAAGLESAWVWQNRSLLTQTDQMAYMLPVSHQPIYIGCVANRCQHAICTQPPWIGMLDDWLSPTITVYEKGVYGNVPFGAVSCG